MTGIMWYLRWKWHLFRKDNIHIINSPKTFLFIFITAMGYAFFIGDRALFLILTPFFLFYWVALDYSRGVPRSWKYRTIVEDEKKRRGEHNGTAPPEAGERRDDLHLRQ